jgi:hypothetical protein
LIVDIPTNNTRYACIDLMQRKVNIRSVVLVSIKHHVAETNISVNSKYKLNVFESAQYYRSFDEKIYVLLGCVFKT